MTNRIEQLVKEAVDVSAEPRSAPRITERSSVAAALRAAAKIASAALDPKPKVEDVLAAL